MTAPSKAEKADGKPLDWCVVHDEARRPDWRDSCWALSVNVQLEGDCQFESQIRVKVTE